MIELGIVGAGKAAALHAEAAALSRRVRLIGVSTSVAEPEPEPGSCALADAASVPHLSITALVDRADVLIVAVPPSQVAAVVAQIRAYPPPAVRQRSPADGAGPVAAMLIEAPTPVERLDPGCPALIGVNLLHAPVVRQALEHVGSMTTPHHLELRSTIPAPGWGTHGTARFGGAALDPGARLAPVLLAAAGEPVVEASALVDRDPTTLPQPGAGAAEPVEREATISFTLTSGRVAGLHSAWRPGSASAELEVADGARVVSVQLVPVPTLTIDGHTSEPPADLHPLVALGFVAQIDRLARVAEGASAPWLDLGAGHEIVALIRAAVAAAP